MENLTVRELFDRVATRGTGAYGLSDVNQLEHAVQSAALAHERNLGDAMVIAALFHDVGHLFTDEDVDLAGQGIDDRHEHSSADLLHPLFGASVSEPVRLHVASKRYLCSVEPDYFSKLAQDSKISLELQGGPLTSDEVAAFEQNPFYKQGVALRRIDDEAKVPDLNVPDIYNWLLMAEKLAAEHAS